MELKNKIVLLFRNLVPQEESFYECFKMQVRILEKSIPVLKEMIQAPTPWDPRWSVLIKQIEEECDHATKNIHEQTEKVFVLPLDQEDIKGLTHRLDEVMDFVEEAVTLIVDWQFASDKDIRELLKIIVTSIQVLSDAIKNLKGFGGFQDNREKMRVLENAADKIHRDILRSTYDLDVCAITRKYDGQVYMIEDAQKMEKRRTIQHQKREVADRLEDAIDACNHVFHVLGNIHAKHT